MTQKSEDISIDKILELEQHLNDSFDSHNLESCIEAIEKMGWGWDYKWELIKKLIRLLGNDMFAFRTHMGVLTVSYKIQKEKQA